MRIKQVTSYPLKHLAIKKCFLNVKDVPPIQIKPMIFIEKPENLQFQYQVYTRFVKQKRWQLRDREHKEA
jgi:hypothetical protein